MFQVIRSSTAAHCLGVSSESKNASASVNGVLLKTRIATHHSRSCVRKMAFSIVLAKRAP